MSRLLSALLTLIILHGTVIKINAAEPTKTDLFVNGDSGYVQFHIPGIAVSSKGTYLAWCEARRGASDWAGIDIVLRRSTDQGKTWSELTSIANVPGPHQKNEFAPKNAPADVTYNNPVLIAARDGSLHLLFCIEYQRCFYQRSDDDGLSWSSPVEITKAFETLRDQYPWKVLATGPNHGIELTNGRLLAPVWLSTGTGGNGHRPSVTSTIFSDDGGKTWQIGEIAIPCTDDWVNPNETAAVQLVDGRVMLNARNESKRHRRLVTISPDGSTNWSEPKFEEALVEPICMAGLVRYSLDPPILVFSNPDNLTKANGNETPGSSRDRINMTIQLSEDDGKTWTAKRVLEPGPGAYSDLAVDQKGNILCFYGTGKRTFAGDRLTLAKFPLEWVKGE